MNKILYETQTIMLECMHAALPDIRPDNLENDGAVYYMNGKNGTAFDWYVNEHLPCFFIFYNDADNLGAVKAMLYTDGALSVYVYGDNGHAKPVLFERNVEATSEELLKLAVLLTENADDRRIWDADITALNSDAEPDREIVERFISQKEAFEPMIERKKLLPKTVIVSKKVREGGWKIGYGMRDEPDQERDSGWYFAVGDETEEYVNDPSNLELWTVNSALLYDPALSEFISAPYGTAIVRTGSDRFETDAPGKEVFIEKKPRSAE
jgi:hypothetical protein